MRNVLRFEGRKITVDNLEDALFCELVSLLYKLSLTGDILIARKNNDKKEDFYIFKDGEIFGYSHPTLKGVLKVNIERLKGIERDYKELGLL